MNAEGMQSILELAQGEASVLLEIIHDVLDFSPALLADLARAIDQQQAPQVKLTAHSLKSSSAQIGALTLAELCAQLERQAAAGDLSEATGYLQMIRQVYQQLETDVRLWEELLIN